MSWHGNCRGASGQSRHGEVYLPAGGEQVLSDLAARLPGAHHQHRAVGQLRRVAVVMAVQLADVPGSLAADAGTRGR